MPQAYSLSNGNLHVTFDAHLQMRDVYYPYVGEENHSAFGAAHRVGVWVADSDGQHENFRWSTDPEWEITYRYLPSTLVAETVATHQTLGIRLTVHDGVYTTHDVLLRRFSVENLYSVPREVRLFFHHDLYLYGDKQQDTAQYEPAYNAVLHYRNERYFMASGLWEGTGKSLYQWAVGKSHYGDKEGTYKDAEDGELGLNPIEQGSVDSVISFRAVVPSEGNATLWYWLAAGKNYSQVCQQHERVLSLTPQRVYAHTRDYWQAFSQKHQRYLPGLGTVWEDHLHRSVLLIRSQIDNRGAIIAACDSDIMKFNKDTYTYMWPRDGAIVSTVLSRLGYWQPVERFFEFCAQIIMPEGYVMHKFTPSGALGSSWHPKYRNGQAQLPIQEDESALILLAMERYYHYSRGIEVVQRHFNGAVLRLGDFLLRYVQQSTGLPRPSYDLWEEQYGVFSYTTAATIAGLRAAERLSTCTGHLEDSERYRVGAERMQQALEQYLWSEEASRFLKKLSVGLNGKYTPDATVDASLCFLWKWGVLPPDDPRIVSTMQAIASTLSVQNGSGGVARYSGDMYQRNYSHSYSAAVPGNPWIICTLWLSQWYTAMAHTRTDLHKAKQLLDWAASTANPAGILPEQRDPFTGAPLSVAPLTWSHATFIEAMLDYSERYASLQ